MQTRGILRQATAYSFIYSTSYQSGNSTRPASFQRRGLGVLSPRQVDVYSRQGCVCVCVCPSVCVPNQISKTQSDTEPAREKSCTVHMDQGNGRGREGKERPENTEMEYANNSRLILLCESPRKCQPTSVLITAGFQKNKQEYLFLCVGGGGRAGERQGCSPGKQHSKGWLCRIPPTKLE